MIDGYDDPGSDLRVGDHVLVEADTFARPVSFRTVLVKVCPTELWLGMASPDRRLEALSTGNAIRLTVAQQDAALLGRAEFRRALGESRSRIFAVTLPGAFEQARRRAYVRYEIDLPVRFRHLDPLTSEPRGRSAAGTTLNVSAGGMLLRTDASVAVGDKLDVTLPLSGGDRISTTDRVIRVGQPAYISAAAGGERRQSTEVAVKFTRITAPDQDWIVRYALTMEHRRREAARLPSGAFR